MSTAMFIFEILYNCLVYKLMYKIRPKTCYSKESLSDSFLFIFFFFKHNHIRYRIKCFVYLESPLDSKTAADWCGLANLSSSKIYIYKEIYIFLYVYVSVRVGCFCKDSFKISKLFLKRDVSFTLFVSPAWTHL